MPKVFRPFQSDSAAGKNGANVNSVVYQRTGAQGVPSQQQVTKVRNWQKPFDPKTQLQLINRDNFSSLMKSLLYIDSIIVPSSRNGNLIPAPDQFLTNNAKFLRLYHLWKSAFFFKTMKVDKSSNRVDGVFYINKEICDFLAIANAWLYYCAIIHTLETPSHTYARPSDGFLPSVFVGGDEEVINGITYYKDTGTSVMSAPGMGAHFALGSTPVVDFLISPEEFLFDGSLPDPVIPLDKQYTSWSQVCLPTQA